ncbi:choline-binding protein D [Streptococcus sp. HMSC063B03]|uniref:N-acetylmuramoyl-L-alanine amidase n=2 Tax=Streptococcus TaxID=1301 RepID=A0A1X1KHU2_STRMT|nr:MULTISPECIES: SH3 domain-containing protein [Streptococcus]OHP90832.1 choline-binding protein D [Streptococcus sp. HMSC063B03]ORO98919.1 choline-binding protein D [Streptococcus mitis]REK93172.1 CHAP domain-containing protein [Streptococcus sp. NM]RSJ90709.1 Autolysin [Streptococcus mitis]TPD58035.1 CHAP domain-containing protein [Streptococcus symci]
MKISPFKVAETRFSIRKSVKKVVPFLVVGLMLSAGESVHANSSYARGDDYPAYYKNGSQSIDKWRMYSRQCTSFAAFRLSGVNGFELPGAYGNAGEWGYRARREGYRVDNTPAIGSIAWSTAGGYGHVAWVSNVMGDNIEIEEYNYDYKGNYNKRIVKANKMTGFIHFKDLSSNSKEVPSSSKDSTSNHVVTSQSSSLMKGTHYFKVETPIKDQPLLNATPLAYYSPGESVHYDQVIEKDGYKWLSYISYSGSRRYIQLEGVTSSQNQSVNKSNHGSNNGLTVGWKKINGSWYYFKSDGSKSTGWLKDGSTWYYLKSSGEMQTGWLQEKGFWYYLDDSGAMKTGWYQVSGKWYYSYSSGELAVNTIVDGYTVNHNGEWI